MRNETVELVPWWEQSQQICDVSLHEAVLGPTSLPQHPVSSIVTLNATPQGRNSKFVLTLWPWPRCPCALCRSKPWPGTPWELPHRRQLRRPEPWPGLGAKPWACRACPRESHWARSRGTDRAREPLLLETPKTSLERRALLLEWWAESPRGGTEGATDVLWRGGTEGPGASAVEGGVLLRGGPAAGHWRGGGEAGAAATRAVMRAVTGADDGATVILHD
jgi:hypothetical protein